MTIVISTKPRRAFSFDQTARWIALLEGKQKAMNIAQIRECLAITLDLLAIEYRDNPRGLAAELKRQLADGAAEKCAAVMAD